MKTDLLSMIAVRIAPPATETVEIAVTKRDQSVVRPDPAGPDRSMFESIFHADDLEGDRKKTKAGVASFVDARQPPREEQVRPAGDRQTQSEAPSDETEDAAVSTTPEAEEQAEEFESDRDGSRLVPLPASAQSGSTIRAEPVAMRPDQTGEVRMNSHGPLPENPTPRPRIAPPTPPIQVESRQIQGPPAGQDVGPKVTPVRERPISPDVRSRIEKPVPKVAAPQPVQRGPTDVGAEPVQDVAEPRPAEHRTKEIIRWNPPDPRIAPSEDEKMFVRTTDSPAPARNRPVLDKQAGVTLAPLPERAKSDVPRESAMSDAGDMKDSSPRKAVRTRPRDTVVTPVATPSAEPVKSPPETPDVRAVEFPREVYPATKYDPAMQSAPPVFRRRSAPVAIARPPAARPQHFATVRDERQMARQTAATLPNAQEQQPGPAFATPSPSPAAPVVPPSLPPSPEPSRAPEVVTLPVQGLEPKKPRTEVFVTVRGPGTDRVRSAKKDMGRRVDPVPADMDVPEKFAAVRSSPANAAAQTPVRLEHATPPEPIMSIRSEPVATGIPPDPIDPDAIVPGDLRPDIVREPTSAPTTPVTNRIASAADVGGRVIEQVAQVARQTPGGPIEIALNPEELGRVRMHLTPGEAGLVLVVSAERPETLDLLRRNIDLLAGEYRELGYSSLEFDFGGNGARPDGGADHAATSDDTPDLAVEDDTSPGASATPATGMDIRI